MSERAACVSLPAVFAVTQETEDFFDHGKSQGDVRDSLQGSGYEFPKFDMNQVPVQIAANAKPCFVFPNQA